MVSMSRSVPVNPADAAISLSRDEVWDGLERKAENALPFVKVMSKCEVIERDGNVLLREIEIDGEPFQERVTLTPKEHVEFVRTRGSILGTIHNFIDEDEDGELALRFSFELEVPGLSAEDEQAYGREVEENYLQAVGSTLAACRRIASEGRAGAQPERG